MNRLSHRALRRDLYKIAARQKTFRVCGFSMRTDELTSTALFYLIGQTATRPANRAIRCQKCIFVVVEQLSRLSTACQ